jgi:hypothetical protein
VANQLLARGSNHGTHEATGSAWAQILKRHRFSKGHQWLQGIVNLEEQLGGYLQYHG